MSRTRYENTSNYDPGRFRYTLIFFQKVVTEASDGSQNVSWTQLVTSRAIRTVIPRRFGLDGALVIDAGSSDMYDFWDFIVRKRSDFTPAKDMSVTCGPDVYTVRTVKELDEPTNYIKLQLVKTDLNLTT